MCQNLAAVCQQLFSVTNRILGSVEREVVFAGERVRETWREGRLVLRRVRTDEIEPGTGSEAPPSELLVRYSGPLGPTGISERVDLSHDALGYSLSIRSYEIEELECTTREPDPSRG